jgi:hypothetical protein
MCTVWVQACFHKRWMKCNKPDWCRVYEMQEYQSFRIGSDGNLQGVGIFINTEPGSGRLVSSLSFSFSVRRQQYSITGVLQFGPPKLAAGCYELRPGRSSGSGRHTRRRRASWDRWYFTFC